MNAPDYVIRSAGVADLPAVMALLQACELPPVDLSLIGLSHAHLAETPDQKLIGVVGLERTTASRALLRLLAVAAQWRRGGVGRRLVAHCETAALIAGVNELYLRTTAADFFRRLDYQDLSRAAVPAEIAAHGQFDRLCPATTRCLGKRL